jgi:two-component system CheB/CheR fusion protein
VILHQFHEATKSCHESLENRLDLFGAMISSFAPDSIIVDDDLRIRHVYGNAGSYLNIPPGEASYSITDLVPNEMGMELASLLHRSRKTGQMVQGRIYEFGKGKSVTALQFKVAPFQSGPKYTFLVSFEAKAREVSLGADSARSEKRRSNEELHELNQTLQAIQSAIIYPLVIVDKNLKIVNFNPAARYQLRMTEADIGNPIRALPMMTELSSVVSALERSLADQEDEFRIQAKVKDRTFEIQVQSYRGLKNAIQGAVVSFVDNTEITTALEEAKLIKQRMGDILDNTHALVTMKDTSGVFVYGNRRFCEIVGHSPEAIIGRTDDELFGVDQGDEMRERDYQVIKKRRSLHFEEKLEMDGNELWWASSKFPLLDSKRRVQSVCTISLDITERVGRQKQLELFKQAVSSASVGIVLLESKGEDYVPTFVSDTLSTSLGLRPECFGNLGLSNLFRKLLPHHEADAIEEAIQKVRTMEEYSTVVSLPHPGLETGGQAKRSSYEGEYWYELRSSHVKLGEGHNSHLVLTLVDVTKNVMDQMTIAAQQDELSRFGKFATLGEVAAGIAHEINTPLNVITAKLDFIRKLAELDKLEKDRVVKAALEVDRMAKNISGIVTGLKSLVVNDDTQAQNCNINQLLKDTLKVCEYRLRRFGIEASLRLPAKDVFAECLAIQISQILINLINNSIDAVGSRRGRKWIEISLKDLGEQIEIAVTDCGEGIDRSLAEKIMTPFFTTKKNGKGAGIGLSLSRTIARRHGGDLILDLQSKNTSFKLALPKQQ